MKHFIDLSLEISNTASEPVPVNIERTDYYDGADILGKPIGIGREQFPGGMGINIEHVSLSTHTGTHIDAPLHYGPECEGKPAKSISDLPLHWFHSEGVVLDCRNSTPGPVISENEIKAELQRINYTIKPLDIVLVMTGADKLWGKETYFTSFRGMSKEATAWLVDQGVKVIGIDTFGFDAPFDYMLQQYQNTRNPETLWPAHIMGRDKEYCQIERLTNLDKLTRPYGFKVICFPIKVTQCGAGWSRVVAIMEQNDE